MRRVALGLIILSAALAPAGPVSAFEGVLKWRIVQVGKEPLKSVVSDASDSKQVFALSMDKLMSMHGQATVIDSTVYVKGPKVRTDTTARDGKSYFIMNLDSGVTEVVNPEKKQVTQVTPDDMREMAEKLASYRAVFKRQVENAAGGDKPKLSEIMKMDDEPLPNFELVALDEEKTIYGRDTQAYEVRGGKDAVVGWVAKSDSDVLAFYRKLEENRGKLSPHLKGTNPKSVLTREGLPMRVQTLNDRQYMVEDLVEIESKPVSDEMFVVPKEFAKTSPHDQAAESSPPNEKSSQPKKKP